MGRRQSTVGRRQGFSHCEREAIRLAGGAKRAKPGFRRAGDAVLRLAGGVRWSGCGSFCFAVGSFTGVVRVSRVARGAVSPSLGVRPGLGRVLVGGDGVGDVGVVAVVGGVVGQGVPALVVGEEAGEVADGADQGGLGQCGWVGGQARVQQFQQAVHAVEAVVGFEFGVGADAVEGLGVVGGDAAVGQDAIGLALQQVQQGFQWGWAFGQAGRDVGEGECGGVGDCLARLWVCHGDGFLGL